MDLVRGVFGWIGRHRVLATVIFLVLAGAGAFARIELGGSQGLVSDPLVRGTIVQSVYGIGTVTANRSYQLIPGVIGTIAAIYVKEGDPVKKGTELMKIDYTLYKAPFDGTVTFLPNKVGENVMASATVLQLVDLKDRYVLVSLEQQGALRVKPGQKVKLSFDTLRDSNFDGSVTSVYSNSTGYLARIDIAELPERILPLMTADVAITLRTHENVLLLPLAALVNGKYVTVKGGLPRRVEVKVGIVDKGVAEVVSGDLKEGDRVLIPTKAAE